MFIRQSPSSLQKDFTNAQLQKKLRAEHLCLLMFPLDETQHIRCLPLFQCMSMHSQGIVKETHIILWIWQKMIKQTDFLIQMIENKLKTWQYFLEVFYNVTLHLSGTLYVKSNPLFFGIVAIHTMLKHLEKVVETIDVNDEDSDEIQEIASKVTNFKEMAKQMR